MKKEPSLRLFFALWPGDAERAALAAWQAPLHKLCGGRLMRTDTLHATLVFLGDVAEHRMEALSLAAEETDFKRFELILTTAHYWGHNHILYAAPEDVPQPLVDLVSGLEHNLRKHRFHFDQREYKPHITLLRHAQWRDMPLPAMPPVHWRISEFALVLSSSDEAGTSYKVLQRFS